jgi:hypothetical protein
MKILRQYLNENELTQKGSSNLANLHSSTI